MSNRLSDEQPKNYESTSAKAPRNFDSCLAPGEIVAGRYKVVRLLGRGGMGEVYEVEDELMRESVALKTLRLDLVSQDTVVARFQSEMRLARKVAHPCVCRVFETGMHQLANGTGPALRFITMELLHGESLSKRIRRLGRLTKEQALPLAIQMAEGLQAAHELGIVHADFKSSNVLLIPGPDGDRARITDFGLARIDPGFRTADETQTIHDGGKLVGTVAYMSPEQMSGRDITTASDLYSFGIVLFEMATGQRPFDGEHVIHAAMQRATGEGIAVRSLAPDIDPRWEFAIVRCLQRDPNLRFSSAAELAEWLRTGRDGRWNRRAWLIGGGVAVVCASGIGGYWWWSHRPYSPTPVSLEWYRKGVNALHSTTYESARRALEQAVHSDPEFALAHAALAQAYQALDYTELAKDSILKAVTIAQETRLSSADLRRLRAYQLIVSRDYDRAAPLLQEMEDEASPEDKPAAALESGWLADLEGNTDAAARAYERALKLNPTYAPAKLRLGQILQRRRELPAALADFQEAERLFTASSDYEGVTEALWGQANLLIRSNRAKAALPLIERALTNSSTVGSAYLQIRMELLQGVAYRYLGQHQRAEEIARQAIDAADAQHMDNLASSALVDLGNSYLLRGDMKTAEPAFRRALELALRGKVRVTESRAQISLASICEETRRPRDAVRYVTDALAFYSQGGYRKEVIQAKTILGGSLSQQGEYKRGVEVLQDGLNDAAKLGDSDVEERLRERLGEALRDQGNWPAALKEIEHAISLLEDDQSADVRLTSTSLLWNLGRKTDSEASLADVERRLKLNPDPSNLADLTLLKAEMAYDDGRIAESARLAEQARALSGASADALFKASLLQDIAGIRLHREAESLKSAGTTLDELDSAGLLPEASRARLAIGEALVAAGHAGPAGAYALNALEFFEPRGVAEAAWRAHLVAALAVAPEESGKHREAARSALAVLKSTWPAEDMATYLARPNIAVALKRL